VGKTSIEWTDASWNPIVGCTEISPGCANCYAARLAATRLRNTPQYKNLATMTLDKGDVELKDRKPRWTGEVRNVFGIDPKVLEEPLHWRKPRRIFVCDMGDLFHESVDAVDIAKIFLVMRDCPQHTFQVLTKRADRMLRFMRSDFVGEPIGPSQEIKFPLPNVWLGVSVENQHFANERIPLLLATPAAVRWISAEPLLGPIECSFIGRGLTEVVMHRKDTSDPKIDWVVAGGESGPSARPMYLQWARSLRDQCLTAGVPFFFKQWGQFLPEYQSPLPGTPYPRRAVLATTDCSVSPAQHYFKLGKKAAGRLLDGREWNEFPK